MSILERVLNYLKEDNLFLSGGAGVGKSYLVKEIIQNYQDVIALGSTGISAVNINGQTIHSFFSFGICNSLEELEVFDRKNRHRIKEINKILQATKLIVIDEISMVSAALLEMILYRLRGADFKGRVLVVGDFYQLPPVLKKTNRNIFDDLVYAFESSAWEVFDFKIVELCEVKRTKNREFANILNRLRVGELDKELLEYLDMLKNQNIDEDSATVLFGRNYEADMLNSAKLELVNSKEFILKAIFKSMSLKEDSNKAISWKKSLPIVEELKLKEKVPVIFTTNKWGAYYNGQRAIVEHIDDDSIVVQKGTKVVKVKRFSFQMNKTIINSNGEVDYESLCMLEQYPIRLAYAITIHKSQGMSIDRLVCNVNHIFADSQFYVALSRGVDPKFLKIRYDGDNFFNYLKRVVKVSPKVEKFYQNSKITKLD